MFTEEKKGRISFLNRGPVIKDLSPVLLMFRANGSVITTWTL